MSRKPLSPYSVLFADLDGTLIKTKSGETFPIDCNDWLMREDVLNAIEVSMPDLQAICIVTNQGGIESGYVDEAEFCIKLATIVENLQLRFKQAIVIAKYCRSTSKTDNRRKPNIGMFTECIMQLDTQTTIKCTNADMVMIGDMQSDADFANNAGIDYQDVNDLVLAVI